jgi:ComF family protein
VGEEQQELAHTIWDCNEHIANERNRALQRSAFVNVRINILDKMSNIFRTGFFQAVQEVCFPVCCLACKAGLQGRPDLMFCDSCMEQVCLIQAPLCTCCGKPFDKAAGQSHYCSQCLTRPFHYKQARALVQYLEPVAKAVQDFKYHAKTTGLSTFANLLNLHLQRNPLPEVDVIVPVPLHKKRLQQRGFNQALVLARKFFPQNLKKIAPLALERWTRTQPQTGLSRADRNRNVKNAFAVRQPDIIQNQKVLLVDDVYTTGATVNECARILMQNRAREVHVLTLARAVD